VTLLTVLIDTAYHLHISTDLVEMCVCGYYVVNSVMFFNTGPRIFLVARAQAETNRMI